MASSVNVHVYTYSHHTNMCVTTTTMQQVRDEYSNGTFIEMKSCWALLHLLLFPEREQQTCMTHEYSDHIHLRRHSLAHRYVSSLLTCTCRAWWAQCLTIEMEIMVQNPMQGSYLFLGNNTGMYMHIYKYILTW